MDAIHVSIALSAQIQEFVTTERPDKPIFRASKDLTITSINID